MSLFDVRAIDSNDIMNKTNLWRKGDALHPALLNILDMRQGTGHAYTLFVTELLPCVSGKIEFRRHVHRKNISSFCSHSDEAFALLVLQNRYVPLTN